VIAKEELLHLKTKILPDGAEYILDYLAQHHNQIELSNIVLENVPLLIIGRHGMIARVYESGRIVKASQPRDINELLQAFMKRGEKLYLFINLPDLPIPDEVAEVLEEVEKRSRRKDELREIVDEALDTRNRNLFLRATEELKRLNSWGPTDTSRPRYRGSGGFSR